MNIRRATEVDEAVLRELWEDFSREVPEPLTEGEPWEEEWGDTLDDVRTGGVFLADDDGGAIGVARIEAPVRGRAHVQLVHVRERARRQGVAKALLRACVEHAREQGAHVVSLEVLTTNETALAVWRRLGFREYSLALASPIEALEPRLDDDRRGESRAAIHVQSDDRISIDRALSSFVPRLEQTQVGQSANGWTRIADPAVDGDRDALNRLSRELSERLGAVVVALSLEEGAVVRFLLWERGRMVDEYLSVPSYYGEISKADELALAANPTLVSRLTGADRDEVRRVARTAASTAELPPAPELYDQLARLMGLEA